MVAAHTSARDIDTRDAARRAMRWAGAIVLLAVGGVLLAATAYVAYVARLWTAASRGERQNHSTG